jgi:hypothetical protein
LRCANPPIALQSAKSLERRATQGCSKGGKRSSASRASRDKIRQSSQWDWPLPAASPQPGQAWEAAVEPEQALQYLRPLTVLSIFLYLRHLPQVACVSLVRHLGQARTPSSRWDARDRCELSSSYRSQGSGARKYGAQLAQTATLSAYGLMCSPKPGISISKMSATRGVTFHSDHTGAFPETITAT